MQNKSTTPIICHQRVYNAVNTSTTAPEEAAKDDVATY